MASIIDKIKKYGLGGAVRYVFSRFLRTDIHKAHYLRLKIDIDKLNSILKDFELPVKELEYEDFLKGDPNVFKGAKMELYRKRFQDNTYKAYGIMENDRLVYSTWISYNRVGMTVETKPVYLLPNEGYLEDSYCDPIARGRGFHGKMNSFRIKKIYESGRNRVIAIVLDGNIPAMKVQMKCGFEDLGVFYHGTIFGFKINTLKKELFDKR